MKHKKFLVCLFILALLAANIIPAAAAPDIKAIRIRFQPGATSAVTSGTLAPRQTQEYVLRAMAGQIMQVVVWPNAGARLAIWGADGTQLKADSDELGWQGTLPKTQDYRIQVTARGQNLAYCLRTTVYGRIQFERGATTAGVSSPTSRCTPQAVEVVGGYALRALAGQTMRVEIDSPNHNTYLTVTGADGKALKYYDDWNTAWEGVLPGTQDYYLLPVSVGKDARFTIKISISPINQPVATRIRFALGAESATVDGRLEPGGQASYVLWAGRGQRMELNIRPTSSNTSVKISMKVIAPNGQTWGFDSCGAINPLPISGDYTITLTQRSAASARYTLEVRIPAK